MTDEVKEEQTSEVTPESEEAAFAAGFAEARGEEPPIEATTEPVQEAEPQPEPVVEEKAPEPEPVFAGLTEEQLKAQLAKAGEVDELKTRIRELYGRFGTIQGEIKQMSNRGQTKVSPEQFKRLSEAWGEDTAKALAEDLSDIALIAGGQQQPTFDPSILENKFQQELAKIKQEQEVKLLSVRHRDWQTIRSTDDFKLWEQQLPAEERQTLNESWDAMYIADKFDEFKAWRAKSQESQKQKQQRLSAAVTPTRGNSAAPATVNDDDAFLSGFKSVRGR